MTGSGLTDVLPPINAEPGFEPGIPPVSELVSSRHSPFPDLQDFLLSFPFTQVLMCDDSIK